MSWPGSDPFYNYNSADGDNRRGFYGLNWVPYFVVDGNTYNQDGYEATSDWTNRIAAHAATSAPLSLQIEAGSFDYATGEGSCTVSITPESGLNGTYKLYFVLVEDSLYYRGANGYPDHHAAMRDILPSTAGLEVTLVEGVPSEEVIFFNSPFHLVDGLHHQYSRFVAFVQDPATKEVVNAATRGFEEMFPVNMPKLSIQDPEITMITDDGDGKLNPGESVALAIQVENDCDWDQAAGITGVLRSMNPDVTLIDSVSTYQDLMDCESLASQNELFSFAVDAQAPAVAKLDFILKLSANESDENRPDYEKLIPITVKMDMFLQNFPVDVRQPIFSGSAAYDLNADGTKEIIVGGRDSLLHVFELKGGELDGFPFQAGNWILGSPAVADIDQDGAVELIVTSLDKNVYVIESDGSATVVATAGSLISAAAAVDDLDSDGDLEIVTTSFAGEIIVVHHDGTPFGSFPVSFSGEVIARGVALADMDNDGRRDIVFGTWTGSLHAISLAGEELPGFPVDLGKQIQAAPVVADLDGDGSFEILIGQDAGDFFAISSSGDTLWTKHLSDARIRTDAAVCDFNADGLLEVIYSTTDGDVTVLDYQGNELPGWPQYLDGACYSSPVVADLDNDGIPEIIVGSNSSDVFAFHLDGSHVKNYPLRVSSPVQSTPTVDDLNQDDSLEIIVGTDYDLTVINPKLASVPGKTWFTSRGNLQRTGVTLNALLSAKNEPILPALLLLEQNFPNPFNAATTIEFGLPEGTRAQMIVFDALGHEVRELINTDLSAGHYSLVWNGLDKHGKHVETGIYFAKLSTLNESRVLKMIVMK